MQFMKIFNVFLVSSSQTICSKCVVYKECVNYVDISTFCFFLICFKAISTCYHCFWVDEYNGGTTYYKDFNIEDFDSRSVDGVNTSNCRNNLDLVPTIQCAGDCTTLDFISSPNKDNNDGNDIVLYCTSKRIEFHCFKTIPE